MTDVTRASPPEAISHPPTPVVVIAAGALTARAAAQAQRLYLRGDRRRPAASAFFRVQPKAEGGLALAPLDTDGGNAPSAADTALEQRRAALRLAVGHGPALKASLEGVLHTLRVHERLLEAGWAGVYDVPLNFIVVADAGDLWAAGVVLPLAAILNEIIANTSLCQAHCLLATGVFPGDPPDHDLAVWSLLQALDDCLRPESEGRTKLAEALGLRYAQPFDMPVYLFDHRKAGTAVVRDRDSLSTLLGNALLALLQGDVARRLYQGRDEDLLIERGAYYGTLGAAALAYDPESLQALCARRIAHAFVKEKILAPPADGQAALAAANRIEQRLGGLAAWLERLAGQLPATVGPARLHPETQELAAMPAGLNLAPLDYERVREAPWAAQLREHLAAFEQSLLPDVAARLDNNTAVLQTHLAGTLAAALDHLPREAELYPGGLQNAQRAAQRCLEMLRKTGHELAALARRVAERRAALAGRLAANLEKLERLLANAPGLPGWARLLPVAVRRWLAPLVLARRYGRQLYQAQALRDECVALLADVCGLDIETAALERLAEVVPELEEQVSAALGDLQRLQATMVQALAAFSAEWGAFPPGGDVNGWDPVFRQSVTDARLAAWAYEHWRPNLDAWVPRFLAASPLSADWRRVEAGAIAAWVELEAARAYQPVWTLDLEAIFALWMAGGPGFAPGTRLSAVTLQACMAAAVPPLHADFDAVGGAAGASQAYLGLLASPHWRHCALPAPAPGETPWQPVFTGDPYTALQVQARLGVPLRALVDSFLPAWQRLEGLPPEQRQAYDLLRALDRAAPATVATIDPDSPDVVHKVFTWTFQPRGSSKTFEQSIRLGLRRSAFEYYRRQPRLAGQWNAYAELELPEVRALAIEFQALHARHKWSTFNQAYNVLRFVQACIPYSYDRDTTGHEDWARYPIETLMEGTGDCEDVAILCAAILARLGFQTVLLLYPRHLAFGVAGADNLKGDYVYDAQSGARYFYGEATADGWHLGQIPKAYIHTPPEQILPVKILLQDD